MKKYIVLTIFALFPLISFAETDVATNAKQYNTDIFKNCTILESNEYHDIYQCPTDIEWIVDLKQNDANAMFQRGPDTEDAWKLVMTDSEHDYVEVSFDDIKMCEDGQTPVRVKIKNPEMKDDPSEITMWATFNCK